MEGRIKKRMVILPLILLIILTPLISPIITDMAKGYETEDKLVLTFDPVPNEPPEPPINPSPANKSVDVRVPIELSVDVYDGTTRGPIDVYFYNASNDALIGIDYGVSASWGTATVVWDESLKGEICQWYARGRDYQYFGNKSDTFVFVTRPNQPSIILNNEYPQNTSSNIPLNATCRIEVSDEDSEDNLTIFWFENTTGDWVLRQTNSTVKNGTYYWNFTQATSFTTKYWWKVIVNDTYHNTTEIFHFTTTDNHALTISSPIPANQTVNVSKVTAYWYVTIEDSDNDNFNWTIETSPDVGSASGTDDSNGQKALTLLGLEYITNYTVYVNATDSVNGTARNETYWFITAVQEAPTISNEYPPNRNTQTEIKPICHVDVHDLEGDNLTVYWYENTTGSHILRRTDENITANSTVYWTFSQASAYSTTYYWRVAVNDSIENTSSDFYFTTESEPSSSPPGGGGGGEGGYIPPTTNTHPIANMTGPHVGYVNETLIFYAYYSYDPDGYIVGYKWDFDNDGVYETDWLEDLIVSWSYSNPGNYSIRLQVKDDDGIVVTTAISDIHTIQIFELEELLQLPIPQTNGPYVGLNKEYITFNSTGSYDPDGSIVNFTWDFGDGNKSYLMNPIHSYMEPGNYTVSLTVTDDDGLSNSTTTKAIILDRETVVQEKEKEKRELPLSLLWFLILILIVSIIVTYLVLRRYMYKHMEEEVNRRVEKKTISMMVRRRIYGEPSDNTQTESSGESGKTIAPSMKKDPSKTTESELDEIDDIDFVIDALVPEPKVNNYIIVEDEKEALSAELLKMIYSEKVDVDEILNELGITEFELRNLVDKLVDRGLLKYNDNDEVEITEEGKQYIKLK